MPYKTDKIALDTTFKQRRWFAQQCGYARFAYNQALSDFKMGLTLPVKSPCFSLWDVDG